MKAIASETDKMSRKYKIFIKFVLVFLCLFFVVDILFMQFGLREKIYQSPLFSEEFSKNKQFFIVFSFSVLMGVAGFKLAKKKRRNPRLWALLCFFLNIWGVLLLYLLPIQEKEKNS